ncbi:glycoside hydrolase family 2 TIM barrel-domain containing protein [Paenibacillus gorillae]|uniref:glycoside hydrolase family 2 TIM barrel-domain containing protein n=1 Tax=Paenibacillus gorillae TaxID=1243662 RepID=UPI0004BA3910|nr:glycoside hydrolase family 2 TIM barrel-domain containing protein [Paenibacillus gorillae]
MHKQRLIDGWQHYTGSLGGVWEVWRSDKLNNHYNVPWQEVKLPHSYNAYDVMDPNRTYYQGQGWYRLKADIDNPYPGGRTLLHFEGAGQRTDVYVYTNKAGSHLGGYDEFTVDITDAAKEAAGMERYAGKVPIAICSDNSRDLETIPSDANDFHAYGGVYRYLNLVYVPAISVGQVQVTTEWTAAPEEAKIGRGPVKVQVDVSLYNPLQHQEELAIAVVLLNPQGKEAGRATLPAKPWTGTQRIADFELNDPERWSTDTPKLYSVVVILESVHGQTEHSERFGFRTFEFTDHGPFLLNGERLLLRGTHRHEDFAGVGPAMTEAMIREELQVIKEMGVNFIRLGHYQQSRIVLDLCDELGILAWEEIPWSRGGLGGEGYRQQCRDMLEAMITQHRNHPSIVLWGLGNENDWECDFDYFDQNEIRAFMKELHELSHRLDPSRLTAIRRCDFCKDIVDVYSPSIWAGWYRGIYTDYEESCKTAAADVRSFFHAEWGADNLATRHVETPYTGFASITGGAGRTDERDGDYLLVGGEPRVSRDGDWSETYFCEMIDWYLSAQERMDWLTGAAQWAFKDFATPVRPDSPIPYLNMKGVVERDLTKKDAYYVFQSYWATAPMIHLAGQSMPVRWGAAGESKVVKAYSNCASAELFLNGVSQGMKRRDSNDFPAAGLRWEVVFKEGENRMSVVAEQDGVVVRDERVFHYQTEAWGQPAEIRLTAERQDATGLYEATVKAYDRHGVFCPDAAGFIRFGAAGDGKLLDNLGTVRGSRLVQLASGRASLFIDPHGAPPPRIAVEEFFTAGGPASSLQRGSNTQAKVSHTVVSAACEGMATVFATISDIHQRTMGKKEGE